MRWAKKHYFLFLIILVIILINGFFFFVQPDVVVSALGVQNTYFVIFLIAVIGGMSSLTGAVFFSSMLAFAAGGANLWLLGLFGGLGLFISDSVFYFLALAGKKSIPPRWEGKIKYFEEKLHTLPNTLVYFLAYVFLGFTPVPNDLIMATLAVGGYRYRKFFPYLLAGNISLALATAYLGDKVWWV